MSPNNKKERVIMNNVAAIYARVATCEQLNDFSNKHL